MNGSFNDVNFQSPYVKKCEYTDKIVKGKRFPSNIIKIIKEQEGLKGKVYFSFRESSKSLLHEVVTHKADLNTLKDAIHCLLRSNVDVNHKDEKGVIPLVDFVRNFNDKKEKDFSRFKEVVKLLIVRGSGFEQSDDEKIIGHGSGFEQPDDEKNKVSVYDEIRKAINKNFANIIKDAGKETEKLLHECYTERKELSNVIKNKLGVQGIKDPVIYGSCVNVALGDDAKEFKISEFLKSDFCKKNEIRESFTGDADGNGIHSFVSCDGTRHYKFVINDGNPDSKTPNLNVTWYVDGKECKAILQSDKDGLKLVGGIEADQKLLEKYGEDGLLSKNKEVIIDGLSLVKAIEHGRNHGREMRQASENITSGHSISQAEEVIRQTTEKRELGQLHSVTIPGSGGDKGNRGTPQAKGKSISGNPSLASPSIPATESKNSGQGFIRLDNTREDTNGPNLGGLSSGQNSRGLQSVVDSGMSGRATQTGQDRNGNAVLSSDEGSKNVMGINSGKDFTQGKNRFGSVTTESTAAKPQNFVEKSKNGEQKQGGPKNSELEQDNWQIASGGSLPAKDVNSTPSKNQTHAGAHSNQSKQVVKDGTKAEELGLALNTNKTNNEQKQGGPKNLELEQDNWQIASGSSLPEKNVNSTPSENQTYAGAYSDAPESTVDKMSNNQFGTLFVSDPERTQEQKSTQDTTNMQSVGENSVRINSKTDFVQKGLLQDLEKKLHKKADGQKSDSKSVKNYIMPAANKSFSTPKNDVEDDVEKEFDRFSQDRVKKQRFNDELKELCNIVMKKDKGWGRNAGSVGGTNLTDSVVAESQTHVSAADVHSNVQENTDKDADPELALNTNETEKNQQDSMVILENQANTSKADNADLNNKEEDTSGMHFEVSGDTGKVHEDAPENTDDMDKVQRFVDRAAIPKNPKGQETDEEQRNFVAGRKSDSVWKEMHNAKFKHEKDPNNAELQNDYSAKHAQWKERLSGPKHNIEGSEDQNANSVQSKQAEANGIKNAEPELALNTNETEKNQQDSMVILENQVNTSKADSADLNNKREDALGMHFEVPGDTGKVHEDGSEVNGIPHDTSVQEDSLQGREKELRQETYGQEFDNDSINNNTVLVKMLQKKRKELKPVRTEGMSEETKKRLKDGGIRIKGGEPGLALNTNETEEKKQDVMVTLENHTNISKAESANLNTKEEISNVPFEMQEDDGKAYKGGSDHLVDHGIIPESKNVTNPTDVHPSRPEDISERNNTPELTATEGKKSKEDEIYKDWLQLYEGTSIEDDKECNVSKPGSLQDVKKRVQENVNKLNANDIKLEIEEKLQNIDDVPGNENKMRGKFGYRQSNKNTGRVLQPLQNNRLHNDNSQSKWTECVSNKGTLEGDMGRG